ncbi:MAG: alpha/beta fold hydrolase [Candidatus Aenigmarchaeota archaeon]|nr:alpha/beta fold hydrolase [Candidatus Aenigmarchaeota archaeon]
MEERLHFRDSMGNTLCGLLATPTATAKSIVILCHGFSSHKNADTFTVLTDLLLKRGIATFRFDFYGHGESTGSMEDVTLTKAVLNLLAAHLLVKKKGFSKVGILGSSFGGAVAIIFSSMLSDIKCLGLKSPVSDYKEQFSVKYGTKGLERWKEKGYVTLDSAAMGKRVRLDYSFCRDAMKYEWERMPVKIKKPVLIVHGSLDTQVPLHESMALFKRLKCRKKLEVVEGAGHGYTSKEHFEKMVGLLARFFANNLRAIPTVRRLPAGSPASLSSTLPARQRARRGPSQGRSSPSSSS